MRAPDTTVVDAATVEEFRAAGCVIVRGLFSSDEVATIREGIERNLADPGPLFGVASRDDDPGRFVEDFCNWQRIDEYRRIAFESKAADVAAALMGGSIVRLYHDHLLVKEPGTRQPTPWHQDQPYYNVEGFDNVSMWAPVDPVARESTLEFLVGSHRQGWLMPRTFLTEQAAWFPEGTLAELPDIEGDRPFGQCLRGFRDGIANVPELAHVFHIAQDNRREPLALPCRLKLLPSLKGAFPRHRH